MIAVPRQRTLPYSRSGRWLKGQLHLHTTRSDGRMTPEQALAAYAAAGFDFVCITDHDRLHTPATLAGAVLVCPGEESTVGRRWLPVGRHLLRLFVDEPLPRPGLPLEERLERTLAAGGLAAACHPLWPGNLGTGRWPLEALLDPRLELMEIVNHHAPVEPTLRLWDEALSRRGPQHPLWGLAVDDAHRPHQVGHAWVWVRLPEGPLGPAGAWHGYASAAHACRALRDALRRGDFYATTGLQVDLTVRGDGEGEAAVPQLVVRCEHPVRMRLLGPGGGVLSDRNASETTYPLAGLDGYVRLELTGPDGRRAWSQPLWA